MSRKNPDPKIQSPIVEAAEKAELLIRGLQNRLAGSANEPEADAAQPDDLDLALEGYFAAAGSNPVAAVRPADELRRRIVDEVAEKILNSCDWSRDGKLTPQFENEVIERLVQRVFERLVKAPPESPGIGSHPRPRRAGPYRL